MMTDPNWIIQKINEYQEQLAIAQDEQDFQAEQRAELEIKSYKDWLAKLEAEKTQNE